MTNAIDPVEQKHALTGSKAVIANKLLTIDGRFRAFLTPPYVAVADSAVCRVVVDLRIKLGAVVIVAIGCDGSQPICAVLLMPRFRRRRAPADNFRFKFHIMVCVDALVIVNVWSGERVLPRYRGQVVDWRGNVYS